MRSRIGSAAHALALAASALAFTNVAVAEDSAGADEVADNLRFAPIAADHLFLLGGGFLSPTPDRAGVLEHGEKLVEARYGLGNTFAKSGGVETILNGASERLPASVIIAAAASEPSTRRPFYVDGTLARLALEARFGLGHGLEAQAVVPVLSNSFGVPDSIVEGFHSAFNLDQGGRKGARRGDYGIFVRGRGGEFTSLDQPSGASLGDVVLALKWNPGGGARTSPLGLRVLVKLPTGSNAKLFGSGSADFALQGLASHPLGRYRLDATLTIAWLGRFETLRVDAQTTVGAALVVTRTIGRRSAVSLELEASQSPFRDGFAPELGRPVFEATLGFSRLTHRGGAAWFVAISENVFNFENSADIELHLGLRHRL